MSFFKEYTIDGMTVLVMKHRIQDTLKETILISFELTDEQKNQKELCQVFVENKNGTLTNSEFDSFFNQINEQFCIDLIAKIKLKKEGELKRDVVNELDAPSEHNRAEIILQLKDALNNMDSDDVDEILTQNKEIVIGEAYCFNGNSGFLH